MQIMDMHFVLNCRRPKFVRCTVNHSPTNSTARQNSRESLRIVVAPGLVRTPASERAGNPELLAFIQKKQPLTGGMVDAEDVARAALFLLGGAARKPRALRRLPLDARCRTHPSRR